MLERPIAPGLRHSSVFLPICPQDKLPSHSLWAERQSSRSCYRITVVFNDTVFYMWFSHPNSNHWNHPLSFNSCVCTFITHNCAALWRSLLLQHPLCPSFSSPSKGLSFLTFKKNNKKNGLTLSRILHFYSVTIQCPICPTFNDFPLGTIAHN